MNHNFFHEHIKKSLEDENLQIALDGNARRRTEGRLKVFASLPDLQARRARAHAIKAQIVAHLDDFLEQFISQVRQNGIQVHRAATAADAIAIFLQIASQHQAHLVAKSKSMVTEEIHFNQALAAAGLQVVETDLGEYIVQLRNERPSHILTPAVHLRREQVGQLFHEKLGVPYTEDIPEMVATARRVLREVFLRAEIGVSGVNFGVVETGTLCMVTNEGNGRMVTTLPPVHVALMGIERLVPTLNDLALFLSLLARSATGQKLSSYTSFIHSARRPADFDGPQERHLILVDNGRSALRQSPLAEALACLRCGACLNACPVFREIGGHAYVGSDDAPATYPGPIGSVISPGLFGCDNFGQLAQASSLCGACKEACPVDIDLPKLLLRIRAGEVEPHTPPGVGLPAVTKLGLKAFSRAAAHPTLFAFGQRLAGVFSKLYAPRTQFMPLSAWTGWGYSKDFPRLAQRSFRARWREIPQQPVDALTVAEPVSPVFAQTAQPNLPLPDQFVQELQAVGGVAHLVTVDRLPGAVAEVLKAKNIARVQVDAEAEDYLAPLKEEGFDLLRGADPTLLAGATGALAGLADTGSVVLLGGPGSALTASLLPDVHLVILRQSQLLVSLANGLALPAFGAAPMAVVVTGPSRTGDIEMALTTGVHGPKEVHVFMIMDS